MVSVFTLAQVDYLQMNGKERKSTYTVTVTNYDSTNGIALTPQQLGMSSLVTFIASNISTQAVAGTPNDTNWNGSMSAPVIFTNVANAGTLTMQIAVWGI